MKKSSNYIKLEFLSRSTNEGFARSAVAAFASDRKSVGRERVC